jgi:hypothetical protein
MRYGIAVGYLIVMTSWIYWLNAGHSIEDSWWTVAPLAIVQIAVGYVIGRWWALLLPLALPVIALPAGYPESQYSEPAPLWFGMIYAAAFAIPFTLVGVFARRVIQRFSGASRGSPKAPGSGPPVASRR